MNARSPSRIARGRMSQPAGMRMSGGRPGPRALVPPPANDNRAPPLTRALRVIVLAASAAAILWTAANLLAGS